MLSASLGACPGVSHLLLLYLRLPHHRQGGSSHLALTNYILLQGYFAKDSKRMFVGRGSKRMVVATRAKPKDIEKRDAKPPPTIFKANTVNKKDLRFLYNILYNDKNKKQKCKLNHTTKGLFLHLKKK